jgi:hypothetical protein
MPVIGRLDEQVNDVLINPVGRRRRRDDGEASVPPDDARTDSTSDATRDNSAAHSNDAPHKRDANARHDEGRGDESLPVWLL